MPDPTLFDGAQPYARATDPASSHLTMKSLGRDTSYNWRIFDAIVRLSMRVDVRPTWEHPVTDDDILAFMERVYERRFQRNVIARQRGIIRDLGWIERVEDVPGPYGRDVVAHIPTVPGLRLFQAETSAP